jgi:CHASE3 domain sensor protein
MSVLKDTIEKLRNLEAEKKSLLLEIDELKKTADTKVTALESEVNALRDEVKSIKILMRGLEPNVKPVIQKIKKGVQNT